MEDLQKILEPKHWLELNAKLQARKNALRRSLKAMGVQAKGAQNTFDNYKYFSEAQYKDLFTNLFSDFGLEVKFSEIAYETFEDPQKQANGRMPKLEFALFDIETGFYELTQITGEGIDKGDKAGYKAYTGALKYFLANTFMVATGDDPERESPDNTMNDKQEKKITPKQYEIIRKWYDDEHLTKLLEVNGLASLEDMSLSKASEIITKLSERGKK